MHSYRNLPYNISWKGTTILFAMFMLFNTHVCQIFLLDATFSFRRTEDLSWPHWFYILLWSYTLGFMDIWRRWRKHHDNDSPRWNAWKSTCNTWEWIKSIIRQRKKGDLWTFRKKRIQNRFCSNCRNLNNIPVSTTAARCSATDLATHEYAQFQPAPIHDIF